MERYNLLIALGVSPAVLTETIWTLAIEHPQPAIPDEIHVVTTLTGERILRHRLFETPDEEGFSVWQRFCREVLQLEPESPEAPTWFIHVPLRGNGLKLDDIRTWDDDRRYAELCYQVVARLCADPEAPRVVASIAGGRKTMSAHLLTAFSLYARPQDESIHVLVHPEQSVLEDLTFFYPRSGGRQEVRIERVDLHLVRFRQQLEELARLHRRLPCR
ncbi:CRISPR-associated ring nuclease Csm6 [Rhodothermus profundi]|uniref:CRISPR-associated protein, NE0113 family n=1 Tax=Rhodothermus profundi TaxID=633813 RepID=A0A1M6SMB4_9BACT|nr:CRISPR-associated ring nuclease Csm6 [Rhodothermus profundi]SHK45891.1 CRISPR-associated protein, NE0113 family [Rhodothermus profundi]